MIKTISILGCGWLGLPLGRHLVQQGFEVKGSTTTSEKYHTLAESGIAPYLIEVNPQFKGEVDDFFSSEILFLNIPFKRNLEAAKFYQQQVAEVIKACEALKVKWIIFASSTSVYPETLHDANEEAVVTLDNPRSVVLYNIEKELLSRTSMDATVIRFAGLYGADRKLGNFLTRAPELKRGNVPVNLIHLDDCIGVISAIIQKNIRNEVINACSDAHPLRRDLYSKAARLLHQPQPVFLDDNAAVSGKIVSNQKAKRLLAYQFKYPDPMQSL